MEKIKLTEREAIQLTIDVGGFKGEELESAAWKKNGSLDGKRDKMTGEFSNRSTIKFIRKLQTLYESVEVEGKGKKRTYILSSKREQQIKIEDRRKFNRGKIKYIDEDETSRKERINKQMREYQRKKRESEKGYCIYRFLDSLGNTLYIGQSKYIDNRMRQHFNNGHLNKECYDSVSKIEFIKVDSNFEMDIFERYLINTYKPIYNIKDLYDEAITLSLDIPKWNTYNTDFLKHKISLVS